jgi:hypothetical protein
MFGKSLLLTIISLSCWANTVYSSRKVIITRRGKEITEIKKTNNAKKISYRTVMWDLEQWRKSITEGDQHKKRPLLAMDYTVFASHIDRWLKNPDLELYTKIDRTWFVKIKAIFTYMASTKRFLEHSKMDGKVNSDQIDKKRENFIKAYDQLTNLIDHPKKITRKRFDILKKEKALRDANRR